MLGGLLRVLGGGEEVVGRAKEVSRRMGGITDL